MSNTQRHKLNSDMLWFNTASHTTNALSSRDADAGHDECGQHVWVQFGSVCLI
jgi:hypothetical protein